MALAVQAYQKRAPFVIDFLADLARRVGRRIPVRLVKGAYWDAEIKRAQVEGKAGYPVFTRKQNTDVSYLATARRMFDHSDAIYPMFATHNAQTIAAIRAIAQGRDYEHQKLHGMGDDLYAEVVPADRLGVPCRVYAPVGSHEDLLPYLVRRLLENGANSSFVNRITDEDVPVAGLVQDPVAAVAGFDSGGSSIGHPRIPLPRDLYTQQGFDRDNSMGANFADDNELQALTARLNEHAGPWRAAPLVPGALPGGESLPVGSPADRRQVIGHWQPADTATVQRALANAVAAQPARTAPRPPAARRSSSTPPACSNSACRSSWPCACAKPERPCPTRSPRCARRSTSCATTPPRRAASSARRSSCRARPANPTSCACRAAACSSASARGTSRWRSIGSQSARRWPPATA